MNTVPEYIAAACVMMGLFLFTWLPFDRKHFSAVALGIILASAGGAYLSGYVAIAAVVAAAGITFIARHLWAQRARNGQGDI
jgi:hypothetical protein